MKILKGIKNSIKEALTEIIFSIDKAKGTECPTVNAVTKNNKLFPSLLFFYNFIIPSIATDNAQRNHRIHITTDRIVQVVSVIKKGGVRHL